MIIYIHIMQHLLTEILRLKQMQWNKGEGSAASWELISWVWAAQLINGIIWVAPPGTSKHSTRAHVISNKIWRVLSALSKCTRYIKTNIKHFLGVSWCPNRFNVSNLRRFKELDPHAWNACLNGHFFYPVWIGKKYWAVETDDWWCLSHMILASVLGLVLLPRT